MSDWRIVGKVESSGPACVDIGARVNGPTSMDLGIAFPHLLLAEQMTALELGVSKIEELLEAK